MVRVTAPGQGIKLKKLCYTVSSEPVLRADRLFNDPNNIKGAVLIYCTVMFRYSREPKYDF
jgi:hypothetical protein